jgi:murein DD-endopeptidase MepM/ murein hydrolase activator NlpD
LTTAERALPIAVAAIVAVASLLALLPNTPAGTTGATVGSSTAVRLAVNGGIRYLDATGDPAATAAVDAQKAAAGESFAPLTLPADVVSNPVAAPSAPGVVQADGTLITGYAPNTTVEDASALIQTYKVRSGDTLSGIATKFKISTMTLWWANSLKSKDALHVGQVLRIPPANGLVITVTATDTLDTLAATYGIDGQAIMDINQLKDPTLVQGQVLIIPGAYGAPIATPMPTPTPKAAPRTSTASTTKTRTTTSSGQPAAGTGGSYSGGRLAFPVIGGNHYISQYFHSGHVAIDIAAAYGAPVVAAAAGKVVWAGWRNDGGGNEVWISHGSLYTRYCHMSAILVSVGDYVGRGQQVGRIGMTGWATGPHLHFEVWVGPIGVGYPVNPMSYL